MNEMGWCPDQAVEALGTFASPLAPEQGRAWIERHREAHQLRMLQSNSAPVGNAVAARRL